MPKSGEQIVGQVQNEQIIVYQAFSSSIAEYAVKNQKFGGENYSFNRMSWIKPNFLWMMFRAGWATKPNQECILAIWLPLEKFKQILKQAVYSSYIPAIYATEQEWKKLLNDSDVRLQWDPDHDPKGNKLERRAIQLGLKNDVLKEFGTRWTTQIEDITAFVRQEHQKVINNRLNELFVPKEDVIKI